jgi:magnesium transporter
MAEGVREEPQEEEPGEALRPGRALYGLTPELEEKISEALDEERLDDASALVAELHPSDVADLLHRLDAEPRDRLIDALRDAFDPELLGWLGDEERDAVVERLGRERIAEAIAEIDTDDALFLLEGLDEAGQRAVLRAIDPADRAILEQGLDFPEDSAGRLMQRELVGVPAHWTIGHLIDFLRAGGSLPDDFYEVCVVDPRHRPIGTIALSKVLRTARAEKLSEIMNREFHRIAATTHQEEVANLFRRYGLVSAPVVSETGRLIGVITVDDVVDVIDEEAGEDILRLGGVAEETGVFRPVPEIVRSRIKWLGINLITAFLAATVIGLFEHTLEAVVALAILMPIVAGMGGNAGTQAMTVVVRAIAVREVSFADAWRVLRKEVSVGLFNGAVFAVLTGAITYLWFGHPEIGVVIGAAMVINLAAAASAGALIPLALERLGYDPAIASPVFLTTVTDCVGFFAFLGLATVFLL